ncbi:P-loop containing nucleoside triphosphate hydrolase protein [Rhizoctonia solani]|uniref:P-loop containing nucleoside triphosphate hydrolase protein n=1 Tax=Rhizoctonia solani TaxID=456999 RepID=A0A8H7I592_9AGAM|nr:P-loop containing nucleoside triphosphate hydrolase protein [Rhizoctonia solani]
MSFSSRGSAPPSRGRPRLNAAGNSIAAGTVRRGGGPSRQTQPCRYFLRGSCRLGSNCQWSHTTARTTERHPTGNQPSAPTSLGYLMMLSQRSSSTRHLERRLILKSYVEDTFKFQTAEQVYRFLSIVCSASSQNTSWTAKDGQLHLQPLVEGNGIVRLADAIRFPKATPRLWSFQRGYIPIFTYLASDWVVKSTMNSDVYALYGLIHSNFEIIQNTVESNMRRLMSARSFRDGPTHFSGKQIFKVMFVTLFEYLTRFKEAPIANPSVRNFAEQIIGWFDEWLVALDSKPPFQDECTTYSEEKREFIIENLQRDRERVSRVINRGQTVVVNNDAQPAYQIPSDADPGLVAAWSGYLIMTDRANFAKPPRSVERLLDIQFRLLREELTSPIRLAVQLIVEDIKKSRTRRLYGVEFEPLELNNRGISVGIEFDTPPYSRARSNRPAVRAEYWQQVSKKRLMQDGLVALIWKDYLGNVDVYVGTVASFGGDLVDCSRKPEGQYRVSIRVSFFDAKANIRIVQALQNRRRHNDTRFLIEAPVFYEGIRPFLEALKREPELLPFAQYLRLQSKQELTRTVIGPPLYSRTPGRMDPSQADAVVDSLTREVALIQGPPGTGKSYTGLELIRVLIKNQIAPILLVAFTNHALDHMLTGILDANITTNIVRLGSRFSIDERLSKYSLSTVERDEGRSRLGSSGKAAYRKMKELEKDMSTLMADISSHKVPASHIEKHISFAYPHHHGEFFTHVPSWIEAIAPKPSDHDEGSRLQFLETRGMKGAKGKSSRHISSHNQFDMLSGPNTGDEDVPTSRENYLQNFMRTHGLKSQGVEHVAGERTMLHDTWSVSHFGQHKEITEQLKAEILSRSQIVGCTTTGMFVTCVAYVILISSNQGGEAHIYAFWNGPQSYDRRRSRQVLESHILASLVGSVEHVILIGDPLQLRPNIRITGKIYKFDQSLMERLSSSGFPMSQIDVQRRMRPEISSLIRNTLYPNLKDNDRVLSYPNVRGMYKNMFFVSHNHKEAGGGEDSISKHNSFEASRHDLRPRVAPVEVSSRVYPSKISPIKYNRRQGCYNKPGNIVILAAYLGQIPKLRKKLEEIVTIVIDERDAELLEQHTMDQEETGTVKEVQLSKQVIIRTLDNFQGEEGEGDVFNRAEDLFRVATSAHLCVMPMILITSRPSVYKPAFDYALARTRVIENVGNVRELPPTVASQSRICNYCVGTSIQLYHVPHSRNQAATFMRPPSRDAMPQGSNNVHLLEIDLQRIAPLSASRNHTLLNGSRIVYVSGESREAAAAL